MENLKPFVEENDVSLKDLIFKLKEYWLESKRNWKLIAIVTGSLLTFMFVYNYVILPDTYSAKVTFMLNDDSDAPSGLSSIIGLIGGGSSSNYSLDKVIALALSRRIIEDALFSKGTIRGKNDYYANHLIRAQNFHFKWKWFSPDLANFYFERDSTAAFSRKENKALLYIYAMIAGNPDQGVDGYLKSNVSETSGIMSLSLTTNSEELSIQLMRKIYEKLGTFYVDKTIEKQKFTYDLIRQKRDSIYRALNRTDYSQASFQDTHFGLIMQTPRVSGIQIQRQNQILGLMYGEAVKNTETADFALKNKIPFVQAIDLPISPLRSNTPGWIKLTIIGLFLGLFLSVGFIIVRKVIRGAMKETEAPA